jgi:hypothetical protein
MSDTELQKEEGLLASATGTETYATKNKQKNRQ